MLSQIFRFARAANSRSSPYRCIASPRDTAFFQLLIVRVFTTIIAIRSAVQHAWKRIRCIQPPPGEPDMKLASSTNQFQIMNNDGFHFRSNRSNTVRVPSKIACLLCDRCCCCCGGFRVLHVMGSPLLSLTSISSQSCL